MMVIEIVAGVIAGSMALLADGPHFTFGVGKISSLAGFASTVLLLGFTVVMATESVGRLIDPRTNAFDHALVVAVTGLLVNGFSVSPGNNATPF